MVRIFNRRSGLTLVELLVVIAIIGILCALLLPAVQVARESARRAQCQNNLKQIALAVHMYHDARQRIPPGECGKMSGGWKQSSRSWSWLARILPYLEQTALYERGRIGEVTLDQSSAVSQTVAVYLCPSDGSASRPRLDAGNLDGFPIGQTNYKGVTGANWGQDESQSSDSQASFSIGTDWPNAGTNGSWDGMNHGDGAMFRVDMPLNRTFARVTDGLSNAYLAGEALPELDLWCAWPHANTAYSTCAIPLNVKQKEGGDARPLWWPNMLAFRSWHSGGPFFAYCDGSIHFVSDSIDLKIYHGMATISGGEAAAGY